MKRLSLLAHSATTLCLLVGCGAQPPLGAAHIAAAKVEAHPSGRSRDTQALELVDGSGLLTFVNDQHAIDMAMLDVFCALRSDAAAHIILRRDGADAVPGTQDDRPFATLQELDDVPRVGARTLEQLYVCAAELGYLFGAKGFLRFVNDQQHTTFEILDDDCGIRADAAANIVAYRDGPDGVAHTRDDDPFDDINELDEVGRVGLWTLEQIYLCADVFGYLDPGGKPGSGVSAVGGGGAGQGGGELDVAVITDTDALEPALRRLVEGVLSQQADALGDPEVPFAVRFSEVVIYRLDGELAPESPYQVMFVQTLDPKASLRLWIVFTLDANYHIERTELFV